MAKPNLALIPAAQGSKLFSVLPSSGVGDFDFTRSGSATRINSQGLIEEVSNGQSRLNYPLIDGKVVGCPHHILEPQRTNLITSSQGSVPVLVNVTQVTNNSISPDGSNNSTLITSNTTSAAHYFGFSGASVTSGISYTGSIFVKKGTGRYFQLLYGSSGFSTTKYITFDLESGIIVYTGANTSGNIESIGKNGWYRLSISATADSTTTETLYCGIVTSSTSIRLKPHTSILTYSIYGAMLEQGSFPTSYIPTNGSTVTRSAETADGSGDADTFNDSEGVLMAEIKSENNDVSVRQLSVSEGISDEVVKILFLDDNTVRFEMKTVIGTNFSKDLDLDIYSFNKFALKYKSNDYSVFVNGIKYSVSQTTSTPIGLNTLNFNSGNGGTPFYGNTKQIQYYNSALTDSELEQLTSWTSFTDMVNGQLYTIE